MNTNAPFEQPGFASGSEVAAVDLSSNGFIAVEMTAGGWNVTAAGALPDGILYNKPLAGQPTKVLVDGIGFAKAGVGGVVRGNQIVVGAAGAFIAKGASAAGTKIVGRALTGAVAGANFALLLIPSVV